MNSPQPVPQEIAQAIAESEARRLNSDPADQLGFIQHAAYFPHYMTDGPGYSGPVVVCIWPAGPEAVSTYTVKDGAWIHCNSTAW